MKSTFASQISTSYWGRRSARPPGVADQHVLLHWKKKFPEKKKTSLYSQKDRSNQGYFVSSFRFFGRTSLYREIWPVLQVLGNFFLQCGVGFTTEQSNETKSWPLGRLNTADFTSHRVLGVYTRSMETIYLSLVHTGSWGYLFHEIPSIFVNRWIKII